MAVGAQPDDLDLVTRTILAEAGNQGPIGQAAVAAVIKNRVKQRGLSPSDVVLQHNQFEPWNAGPGGRNDPMRFDANSPEYRRAQEIARGVFSGQMPDFSGGATHFANVGTVRQRNNGTVGNHGWINPRNQTAQIGGHTFFAPEGKVQGFNQEMTLQDDPTKGIAPIAPIAPTGGVMPPPQQSQPGGMFSGLFGKTGSNVSSKLEEPKVSSPPPILGRMLFGDQGMSGFLNNAIPTPFGGKGILGGGVDGLKNLFSGNSGVSNVGSGAIDGASPAGLFSSGGGLPTGTVTPGMPGMPGGAGSPLMLPGGTPAAASNLLPGAAGAGAGAAGAGAAGTGASAAAGAAPGIGSFLSSLFAMI